MERGRSRGSRGAGSQALVKSAPKHLRRVELMTLLSQCGVVGKEVSLDACASRVRKETRQGNEASPLQLQAGILIELRWLVNA